MSWMNRAKACRNGGKNSPLRSCHVSEELIQSGCIDLDGYAEDLLESSGYTLTADESGYVARNNRPFIREYTQEPEPMEQSMG